MKRTLKRATLQLLKSGGVFRLVRDSEWRRQRLLILCYHGISQEDEHLWRPGLYLQPAQLEQRLQFLRQAEYNVLPLGKALQMLQSHELPPRSVAITFDDGTYDFYNCAFPLLQKYGLPATVYQTTYYCDRPLPVFNLICSYLLWKRRGSIVGKGDELGVNGPLDLTSEVKRHAIVKTLVENCERQELDAWQRNGVAERLAVFLDLDYSQILAKRILQLMNPQEISELAKKGVDFQLHTHRHCMPNDKNLFAKEIRDNKESLERAVNARALHFCYPSGVHSVEFLPWLREAGMISATTCDVGLATADTDRLLLPRMVDTSRRTPLEFEAWLTGVADFMAVNRAASQTYTPPGD